MSSSQTTYTDRIEAVLAEIWRDDRYRTIRTHELPAGMIDFSSNDYLAMATDTRVVQALRTARRAGSGGARLLGGAHREHALLEEELAQWLGRERALLFSSGYHAAIGAIPALAETIGAVRSDERNHAAIIDGVRLSRVPRTIYAHAKLARTAQAAPALVVTESLFGMDGDALNVRAVLEALGADDAVLIDEAHALGVIGAHGGGLAYGVDDPRIIVLGTLSKALGVHGGFVAGPSRVVELLVNRARSFIFDTALPPSLALAARIALRLVRDADDRRAEVAARVLQLRRGLSALGFESDEHAPGCIVPLQLGSEERALAVSAELWKQGVVAPAIRPPTVPKGTCRLRLSVRWDHTADAIDRLLQALESCIVSS